MNCLKNISNTQKIAGFLILVAVVYLLYTYSEKLDETVDKKVKQIDPIVITNIGNTKNIKSHSLEYKQPKIVTPVTLYDRHTGSVVSASEFIGLPDEIEPITGQTTVANYGDIDRLDDGYNGSGGLNYNMCSKSCCGAQYPPPFDLEEDAYIAKNKDKFVPNNYMCNNAWNNSGCVCMTKKQRDYIGSRGNNAGTCSS